jgi:hypothetical protein
LTAPGASWSPKALHDTLRLTAGQALEMPVLTAAMVREMLERTRW